MDISSGFAFRTAESFLNSLNKSKDSVDISKYNLGNAKLSSQAMIKLGTYTNKYFKTLITCAEESNTNYKFDFDNVADLKGKKIGIVFREEEFLDTFKLVKTAVKPFRACTYDKTEEQKVPNKKLLPDTQKPTSFETDFAADNDDMPF